MILLQTILILSLLTSCATAPPQPTPESSTGEYLAEPSRIAEVRGSFRAVAQAVLPSVVELHITIPTGGTTATDGGFFHGPGDDPSKDPPGIGSGVVVAERNRRKYVVTNEHVVAGARSITVRTQDGTEYPGTMVGTDRRRDIALIAFTPEEETVVPVAQLGDSDDLSVGDWVLAVGTPFGFSSTITAGIVSAKHRNGPADNISEFIQTDAAINRGNSGGPLVDMRGEVVGINTWITAPEGVNVGLGFAIPINSLKRTINDLIDSGTVEYGWLGVEVDDVLPAVARELGYRGRGGALISQVFDGSPAVEADLRPGDVIVAIEETDVRDYLHLVRLVAGLYPQTDIVCEIHRAGTRIERRVTIGTRLSDADIETAAVSMWPGMAVIPLRPELQTTLELPEGAAGVVISEIKNAAAPQVAGLRQGDLIRRINGRDTKNLLDFFGVLNDTDTEVFALEVLRKGENHVFTMRRGS